MSSEIAACFRAGGPLDGLVPDYHLRTGQVDLAETIAECLDSGTDLVAEAATGTGKTLAYLVPALSCAGRVIISTGTLNLQGQLFNRDLPLALKALRRERRVALLKGRSNYLCLHRLERHLDNPDFDQGETRAQLETVRRWARHTRTGEIREIAELPERAPVWPLVTSTIDNCLGQECPSYNECHLVLARRKAQEADVVVVNHHLLFADLALKHTGFGEVLPGADAVIIDEAHQIPEVATRFFSRTISAWQVRELLRDTLAACGQVKGALKFLREPLEQARSALETAVSACAELPERGEWTLIEPAREPLARLQSALEVLADALSGLEAPDRDLAACTGRAAGLLGVLSDLQAPEEGAVRWFSTHRGRFALHLTPLDIAGPLQQLRAEFPATWVLTSATLAVDQGFEYFTGRLGLEGARELVVHSPFDYPGQARLWVPEGLPEPGGAAHTGALMERVVPLLAATRGRAFLLFTAHRALRRAAEWLRAHTDFRLLVQEEAPREALLEEFRRAPGSLLLGAASFWEGVDVRGPALSVVVIDKLPFAAPDDPVLAATIRAVREAGGNPFARVQLPAAVLALKQGAGRLIRHPDDHGVLVLGDPRIDARPYGRVFLASLPPMARASGLDEVVEFMRQREAA